MKIGTDIVECKRINSLLKNHLNISNVFSDAEIDNIFKSKFPEQRASGYYAVKESVLKCFGIGILGGLKLNEICVEYEPSGKPHIKETANLKKFLEKNNCSNIEISISHEEKYATAVVVIY